MHNCCCLLRMKKKIIYNILNFFILFLFYSLTYNDKSASLKLTINSYTKVIADR